MIGLLSPGSQPDAAAAPRPPRPAAPLPRPPAPASPIGGDAQQPRRAVCPFCGTLRDRADGPCERCTMPDTPEARRATRARVGPWYVLQAKNPAAPGMQLELLLAFVRRGQVTPRSVIRGPTTYQLWRFAANARGLSRAFGLCYSCQASLEPTAIACPKCHKSQEPPLDSHALLDAQPTPASTGPAALAAVTSNPVMRELPPSAAAAAAAPPPPLQTPAVSPTPPSSTPPPAVVKGPAPAPPSHHGAAAFNESPVAVRAHQPAAAAAAPHNGVPVTREAAAAAPPRVGPFVTYSPAPAVRSAAAPAPAQKETPPVSPSSVAPTPAPSPVAPAAAAAHPPASLMNVQDLAIAFHLSGHTAGEPSTGRRRHRRGHWRDRLRKLVVLALAAVMLALAATVVAVAKPDWRGNAVDWTRAKVTDVRAWLDSFSKPVTPGANVAPKPAPSREVTGADDDGVG